MLTKFNLLSDNQYWNFLKDAQDAHVSNRDKHEGLLAHCQETGVAFADLQNFLLNQAKKVGLYRMDHKGPKAEGGKPTFPPWALVIKTNWGFALSEFMKYSRRYKDYGIKIEKEARPNKNRPVVLKMKRTAADGTVTESEVKIEGVQNSKQAIDLLTPADRKVPEPKAPVVAGTSKPSEIKHSAPVIPPVSAGLSKAQIQAIIINNWSVLGEICREKGAVEEFNLLMDALGIEEEMIIEVPSSLENKYSSVAN